MVVDRINIAIGSAECPEIRKSAVAENESMALYQWQVIAPGEDNLQASVY